MLLRRPRTVSSFFWIPVYDLISQVYNGWRHITLPPVLTPSWSSWARASDTITKPYRARLKPKGQWWARPPSKGGGGEVGGEEWKERRKRGTCGGSRLRRWSLEKRPCSARMKGLNATQRSGSGAAHSSTFPSFLLFFSFLSFPSFLAPCFLSGFSSLLCRSERTEERRLKLRSRPGPWRMCTVWVPHGRNWSVEIRFIFSFCVSLNTTISLSSFAVLFSPLRYSLKCTLSNFNLQFGNG